jgi:DNA invertase Pin-like site-specific DNA recombinase
VDVENGLARRPEPDKALLVARRQGDQLVVTKLDRLGRSLGDLIDLTAGLHERGVDLIVLDQASTPPPRSGGCSSRSSARSRSSRMR